MIPSVAAVLLLALPVVAGLAVYAWTSLALSALFAKAGVPAHRAWVPVLNIWVLFVLAGLAGWWAVVVAGILAVGGVLAAVLSVTLSAAAVDASFGGDVATAQSAAAVALVVPAVVWLAVLIPVVVLLARMLVGVGRRLGFGVGHVVLGVVLFPVWASVAGWGAAEWDAEPAPATAEAAAREDGLPALAPFTPGAPAAAVGIPAAASSAPAFAPSSPPAAEPQPEPTAAEPPAAPSAPAAAPSWGPPVRAAAAPAPAGSHDADIDDETVLTPARAADWALEVPGGGSVVLTAAVVVLGRNPQAPAGITGAQLVAVDDVTRTVSKTHALLRRTPEGWSIVDLDSTNGVFLSSDREIEGPTPVTGAFFLGDAELALRGPS